MTSLDLNNQLFWGFTGKPTTKQQILACVGPGWHNLVSNLIDELFKLGWDGNVFQIKEKFGGLRFYIGKGNDAIWKAIHNSEALSYRICEKCGESGKLRTDGWMKVLCDNHGNGRPTEHSIY